MVGSLTTVAGIDVSGTLPDGPWRAQWATLCKNERGNPLNGALRKGLEPHDCFSTRKQKNPLAGTAFIAKLDAAFAADCCEAVGNARHMWPMWGFPHH
jgi:hypothetical protein